MVEQIKGLVARNAKAIAAFVVSFVLSVAARYNVDVPSEVVDSASALIVAVVVWFTANQVGSVKRRK